MLAFFLLMALQTVPAAVADPALYIVGPNDVLTITVFNQAQLSGKFAVEADGTFAYPLLGRLSAGGETVRAVEDKVRKGLAAGFLTDPQVGVSVDQYRSQQIFVMGEVKQPGPLQFTGSMTLIEALVRAGATTQHAGYEAIIVRPPTGAAAPAPPPNQSAPSTGTIRVNLESLQRGVLAENVALKAGDTVFIPRAETVFVSGHVRTPGEYVIRNSMTVRQVVALAGGVTDRGSTRRVQIVRRIDDKEVTIDVEMQTTLKAGDTVVVNERFF
jgi:polysaccharide export outer membrane protein